MWLSIFVVVVSQSFRPNYPAAISSTDWPAGRRADCSFSVSVDAAVDQPRGAPRILSLDATHSIQRKRKLIAFEKEAGWLAV